MQRITLEGIYNHPWFKKNYVPARLSDAEEASDLDDVESVFDNSEVVKFSYSSLPQL